MKTYTVYFSEPVTMKYKGDRFNKELKRWEHDVDCEKTSPMFTFHSLALAKKLIKENMDKYIDSCITKTWANGDWENLGPIKLAGNNKTFIANTTFVEKYREYDKEYEPEHYIKDENGNMVHVELVSVKAGKNMIITWKDTETGKMFQTIE